MGHSGQQGAPPRLAGLELGGTKCVAVLATGRDIVDRQTVPTTTPAETLAALEDQLARWWDDGRFAALGIGSFGPLALDPTRPDHGCITTTPKPGWSGVDIAGRFGRRFPVAIGLDTDVTGAALAEFVWGAAAGMTCNVYLTIGTGVGGGAIVNGRPLRGFLHPEMGHVRVRRVPGDSFAGLCPYHSDCLEGLVAGPAIAARAGRPASALDADDPVWNRVAADLAEAVAGLILTLSPQRIAIGGGVGSGQPHLLPKVRARVADLLAGYVAGIDAARLATIVDTACFGDDAGPLGAIALGAALIGERAIRS